LRRRFEESFAMTTPARQNGAVAAAVESLHPDHRQILLQAYFRGHSASETARTLGLPLPLVKRRIYEAMQQLRGSLAQEQPSLATAGRRPLAA
jgi:DNA-directed RNA polymerase specialized sigma24 family protein